ISAKSHTGDLSLDSGEIPSTGKHDFFASIDVDLAFPKRTDRSKYGRYECFLIAKCRGTGMIIAQPLKRRSDAGEAIEEIISHYGAPSHIHTDNASELINEYFTDVCRRSHIRLSYSTPHRPQMNGNAERAVGTVKRLATAAMEFANIPPEYWNYAISYAAYVYNHTANTDRLPPLARALGRPIDFDHIRIFGSLVKVKIDKASPFCDQTFRGVFLGRPWQHSRDSAHVFNPLTQSVTIRRDIAYVERELPVLFVGRQWLTRSWHNKDDRTMGGFNHLADSAPHAHPGQGENDHIDDQEDNRINDDQEVTRTDEPDSMVLSETETEDEDENDSPFIVRHRPRVATNADSGESGESGESQETKADERNHQSHIGRRIQKQFEHHSGNWLYEGEITEFDSKDGFVF
ncbi:MAG: hypothetical protein AAFY15_13250, partial [Cyanobacteria bacterium J06648_11]